MNTRTMAILLTFSLSGAVQADATSFLAQQGLAGKTVEQMVNAIDPSTQSRPLPYSASINATQLMLTQGEQKYVYPLGDTFYLSFAPYVQQTHPCFNHSLSGCQGELANTAFNVKITDKQGAVIVHKNVMSYQNGFVGVWLPRNTEGTIEVTYQGRIAQAPFATYDDSQTCMTTLRLKSV